MPGSCLWTSALPSILSSRLCYRLFQLSVPDSTCRWMTDFLSDRTQRVRLGKLVSEPRTISTGAPQGCVLSPLLFSLYTNNCTSSHPSVKLLTFALNCSLYISIYVKLLSSIFIVLISYHVSYLIYNFITSTATFTCTSPALYIYLYHICTNHLYCCSYHLYLMSYCIYHIYLYLYYHLHILCTLLLCTSGWMLTAFCCLSTCTLCNDNKVESNLIGVYMHVVFVCIGVYKHVVFVCIGVYK